MNKVERIEEVAARWLIRQEEPEWTIADQVDLDAWLAQSAEHKVALWRLRDSWSKGDRLASRRRPPAMIAPPRPLRRSFLVVAGCAAALVAAIVITPIVSSPGERFETPRGVQQTVRLADGSRVELNTDTRLRTDLGGERREVWLDAGEAFFEVTHDAARPFVVNAGSHRVTVLGTKFSVRRDGDQVQVSVLEGRVRLDDRGRPSAAKADVLRAGAIARTADAGVLIRQATPEHVEDGLSWRTGVLVFDQVTLAQAVSEFNRYNTRQLVLADPTVSEIRIGGRLQARSINGFTRLLQRTYGLTIEDKGDRVIISQ
jgi:transmembrane sensor